LTAFRRLSTL